MNAPARLYWRFSPKFWDTVAAEDWSDDAIILGAYLMTCRHRTAEGLFRLPKAYVCEDLRWPAERLTEPLAELVGKGFVEVDERSRWVLIRSALKYQSPENPNQVTAALRRLVDIPSASPLTSSFKGLAERYCQRLAEALPEGFTEPTPQPQSLSQTHAPAAEPSFVEGSGPIPLVTSDGDRTIPDATRRKGLAALAALRPDREDTA